VLKYNPPYIAIGSRLKGIPEVKTIGLKPNFSDYSSREREHLLDAGTILYPTLNYAQFFKTMGKEIFPSLESYLYADEKIKQTTLFNMMDIPHPRTRFYYPLHHADILNDFRFPFIAKIPRASAQGRGVFKINDHEALKSYLQLTKVAYIQDFLPHNRDLRVILINYDKVIAYWRESGEGNFRTNLSQGGSINFNDIPREPLQLAQEYAKKCKFNDVGLDFISHGGKWYLIEANMKYGRKGLIKAGLNLKEILREKLLSGALIGR
jgi:ribosomal protein S6--L-glutamate ligase